MSMIEVHLGCNNFIMFKIHSSVDTDCVRIERYICLPEINRDGTNAENHLLPMPATASVANVCACLPLMNETNADREKTHTFRTLSLIRSKIVYLHPKRNTLFISIWS